MSLMLTEVNRGRMTINDYVRWSAVNPAKAWDLYPRKGALNIGSDADIVVVDMDYRGTIDQAALHSRHKYTPWHGRAIAGRPIHTIVRGRLVMRDGVVIGPQGWGAMVKPNTTPGSPRNIATHMDSLMRAANGKPAADYAA
jgi:dihydroorotase